MPPRRPSRLRRLLRVFMLLVCVGVLLLSACIGIAEGWTRVTAKKHCHAEVKDCPTGAVALVLGCSPRAKSGGANYYFRGRMQAAAALWHAGRVQCLIVSGDNSSRYYNEPRAMQAALVAQGVPADRIVCDYAGVCTYDSVARAERVFGARKLIIVSQKSHVERAVAIARHLNIEADGCIAPLGRLHWLSTLRQYLRERAARVAMMYDIMTDRTPKHLGPSIPLPANSES